MQNAEFGLENRSKRLMWNGIRYFRSAIRIPHFALQNDSPLHNSPSRDISPADLYAPLFIGVSVGVTALAGWV